VYTSNHLYTNYHSIENITIAFKATDFPSIQGSKPTLANGFNPVLIQFWRKAWQLCFADQPDL
jgi:hypothetical protein